jgi:hypothetical protein
MEIFKFNIVPLPDLERRQAFKEAVNNCPLCGQQLDFAIDVDFLSLKIKEDCICQACQLQIRSEVFDLQ